MTLGLNTPQLKHWLDNLKPAATCFPKPTRQALKSIKERIFAHKLTLAKADKGDTIVILNEDDYVLKVTNFLQKNNAEV